MKHLQQTKSRCLESASPPEMAPGNNFKVQSHVEQRAKYWRFGIDRSNQASPYWTMFPNLIIDAIRGRRIFCISPQQSVSDVDDEESASDVEDEASSPEPQELSTIDECDEEFGDDQKD